MPPYLWHADAPYTLFELFSRTNAARRDGKSRGGVHKVEKMKNNTMWSLSAASL
jgi:hypothetical protein